MVIYAHYIIIYSDVPTYRVHALVLLLMVLLPILSELRSDVVCNTFVFHLRSPHYACPEVIRVSVLLLYSVFLKCWYL